MERKETIKGLICGALAFGIWGMLPLYWRLVQSLNAYQLFSHRVVWSFIFVCGLLLNKGQMNHFLTLLKDKKQFKIVAASALFISVNWLTYIWAVNNNRIVEASLGYFINPLVLTLFGSIFFKERVSGLQKIGIAFAASGVLYKTILYGTLPIIALILAISFAIYGLLKKKANLDSLTSLASETLMISIPTLGYLVLVETTGQGITGNLPFYFWFLIAFSGVATATPLILYAESAVRLPLYALGFLQYISPTLSLLLGVFIFGEAFDSKSMIAFGLIWIGLILFSYAQIKTFNETSKNGVKIS